ncbi:MAG: hypothetical protein KIS94_08515 [Chitinophagales bacterium]|nr:hypothetical protein [Chitinophagales bacterium]
MKYLLPVVVALLLFPSCKTDAPVVGNNEKRECNTLLSQLDTAVLLVMGQSNAANAGNKLYSSYCNRTHNFYAGNYYELNDPLKGANGTGGSVWSRLADKMLERNFAATVIVAPCAIGGTKIEQWIPGGEFNYLIGETVAHLQTAGLKVTHVLWHQGESNHVLYAGGISAQQNAVNYSSAFHLLVNHLRSLGVDAPVYAALTTRCIGEPDYALQDAQRNLANYSLKIYNGPNTDMLGNEFRYDKCHFNEQGLNLHAEMWLEAIRK